VNGALWIALRRWSIMKKSLYVCEKGLCAASAKQLSSYFVCLTLTTYSEQYDSQYPDIWLLFFLRALLITQVRWSNITQVIVIILSYSKNCFNHCTSSLFPFLIVVLCNYWIIT